MSKVQHVKNGGELDAALATPAKLVAIDFSATWCGPCRMISPKFEELSTTNQNVVFVHVDIDELSAHPLVGAVSSVPHFEFYKDGKKIKEFTGANVPLLTSTIKELQ